MHMAIASALSMFDNTLRRTSSPARRWPESSRECAAPAGPAAQAGEPLDVRSLYAEESTTNARRAHATSRTSLSIGAESEVSFCSYFNAFPASYWRRWTVLESVLLRLELNGHCRVDVYRSKADGSRIHVEGKEFREGALRVEWIWARSGRRLDLVRHHHRHRGGTDRRRLARTDGRSR